MKLEKYLENTSMSEATFAELIGVKQATVNRYINGKRFPSPVMIQRIERASKGKVKVMDWFPRCHEQSGVAA